MEINGQTLNFQVPYSFLSWTPYCVMVDGLSQTVSVYQSGSLSDTAGLSARDTAILPEGGAVILGQRHLKNEPPQLLVGEVADLKIWNKVLSLEEIKAVTECRPLSSQPLLDLTPSEWIVNGTATWVTTAAVDNVCQLSTYSNNVRVFLPVDRYESLTVDCHRMGGRIPTPLNNQEHTLLKEAIVAYSENTDSRRRTVCLDLNFTDSGWVDQYTGDNFIYYTERPSPPEDSDARHICYNFKTKSWAEFTVRGSLTTVCEVPITRYIVRGLCKQMKMNKILWLYQTLNGRLIFRSEAGSVMAVDEDQKDWTLGVWGRNKIKVVARLPFKVSGFPFGYQTWDVLMQTCPTAKQKQMLLLTECPRQHFTCRDSGCIPTNLRCDGRSDCRDHSDEFNCPPRFILPEGHSETPPPVSNSFQFSVECAVDVINYRWFKFSDMMTAVDLLLEFRWKDPQLTYQLLKSDWLKNQIPFQSTVWRPDLRYTSILGDEATVEVITQRIFIERQGDTLPDLLEEAFAGSCQAENQLSQLCLMFSFVHQLSVQLLAN